MLAKRRNSGKPHREFGSKLESLKLPVMSIRMSDYSTYHSDKERLKQMAQAWTSEPLELDATTDLESLRNILSKNRPMDSCCFLDCELIFIEKKKKKLIFKIYYYYYVFICCVTACTAERFFRIDRAQEQLHYVTDVAAEAIYVLEEGASHATNESERAKGGASRLSSQQQQPSHRYIYYKKRAEALLVLLRFLKN